MNDVRMGNINLDNIICRCCVNMCKVLRFSNSFFDQFWVDCFFEGMSRQWLSTFPQRSNLAIMSLYKS